jgi:hypothetical protein
MEEIWSQVIIALLSILLPILIPAVAALLFKAANAALAWMRANVNERDQRFIEAIVSQAVRAAEQIAASPSAKAIIASKKDTAFGYIDSRLKGAKLNVSADQIWTMIEAEVHNLKMNGEEVKSAGIEASTGDYITRVLPSCPDCESK